MTQLPTIFVCINKRGGKGCIGAESREVFRALHARARERAKAGGVEVRVERMVCMGYCSYGPNAKIKGGAVFNGVTLDDVERILDEASA